MPVKGLADDKSGPLSVAKRSPGEIPKWPLSLAGLVDGVDATSLMANVRQECIVGAPGYHPLNLYRSPVEHLQYGSSVRTAHQKTHLIRRSRKSREASETIARLGSAANCTRTKIIWHVRYDLGRSALPYRSAVHNCRRSAGRPGQSYWHALSRIEPARLRTRS